MVVVVLALLEFKVVPWSDLKSLFVKVDEYWSSTSSFFRKKKWVVVVVVVVVLFSLVKKGGRKCGPFFPNGWIPRGISHTGGGAGTHRARKGRRRQQQRSSRGGRPFVVTVKKGRPPTTRTFGERGARARGKVPHDDDVVFLTKSL